MLQWEPVGCPHSHKSSLEVWGELVSRAEDFGPVGFGSQYENVPTLPAFLHPLTVDLEMKLGLWGSLPKDGALGFIWQHL